MRLEVCEVNVAPEALFVRALGLSGEAEVLECTTLDVTLVRVRSTLHIHRVRVRERKLSFDQCTPTVRNQDHVPTF